MAETKDPLAALLVDAAEVDRQRIAAALSGRVAIDRSTGLPVSQQAFNDWTAEQKIISFLLARKVAVLLGVSDEEASTPALVAGTTGLPPGTVRPVLRQLVERRQIAQDSGGSYLLSTPQVGGAMEALNAGHNPRPVRRQGASRPLKAAGKTTPPTTSQKSERIVAPSSTSRKAKKIGSSTGRSPTMLVKELVDQGFFSSPRTLAEVQNRLKHKVGHHIPVTTLSPIFVRLLRARLLDREQNDDGVYAYEVHKE